MSPRALSEASAWVARLQGRQPTAEDATALRAWLDASADHVHAFELTTSTWDLLGSAARMEPAEIVAERRVPRRRVLAGMLLGGLATGSALLPEAAYAHSFQTGVAEQKKIRLPDGTMVSFDVCTSLDVRITDWSRMARLRTGRVNLAIVSDAAAPIRVDIGDYSIVSQRSEMDLMRRTAATADVTMLKGSARVLPRPSGITDRPLLLQPGRRLRISGQETQMDSPDLIEINSWQDGYISFNDESLSSVAARINGYSYVKVVVEPDAAALKVSGRFHGADTVAFVRSMEALLPITVRQENGRFTLRARRG